SRGPWRRSLTASSVTARSVAGVATEAAATRWSGRKGSAGRTSGGREGARARALATERRPGHRALGRVALFAGARRAHDSARRQREHERSAESLRDVDGLLIFGIDEVNGPAPPVSRGHRAGNQLDPVLRVEVRQLPPTDQ